MTSNDCHEKISQLMLAADEEDAGGGHADRPTSYCCTVVVSSLLLFHTSKVNLHLILRQLVCTMKLAVFDLDYTIWQPEM